MVKVSLVGCISDIYLGNTNSTVVPMWLKWVASITGLACVMIAKENYDKDDRLADWIDCRVKKILRRP
jgi:hypothetical protein